MVLSEDLKAKLAQNAFTAFQESEKEKANVRLSDEELFKDNVSTAEAVEAARKYEEETKRIIAAHQDNIYTDKDEAYRVASYVKQQKQAKSQTSSASQQSGTTSSTYYSGYYGSYANRTRELTEAEKEKERQKKREEAIQKRVDEAMEEAKRHTPLTMLDYVEIEECSKTIEQERKSGYSPTETKIDVLGCLVDGGYHLLESVYRMKFSWEADLDEYDTLEEKKTETVKVAEPYYGYRQPTYSQYTTGGTENELQKYYQQRY